MSDFHTKSIAQIGRLSLQELLSYAADIASNSHITDPSTLSNLQAVVREIHDVARFFIFSPYQIRVITSFLLTAIVDGRQNNTPCPSLSSTNFFNASSIISNDISSSYDTIFVFASFPDGSSHYVPFLSSVHNFMNRDEDLKNTVYYLANDNERQNLLNTIPDSERLVILQYLACLGLRPLTPEESAIIPPNSPTLLSDSTTSRFSSAIWFQKIQEKVITLAGCGGIGSWVALLLSRLKPRSIFLYDDDKVESVNMAGQFFTTDDIDNYKVNAVASACDLYSAYNSVYAIPSRFTSASEASNIMICGFDNMRARSDFFNSWLRHVKDTPPDQRSHCFYEDGRLAAEECQIFCIRGDDDYNINLYQHKHLFSDDEADPTICSYKQTSYMATFIASVMVNLFVNFVANELTDGIRELPFLTSYEGESLFFQTTL